MEWLAQRNLRPSTILNYRLTANSLTAAHSVPLRSLETPDLHRWVHRARRPYRGSVAGSPATRNRDISILRSLYDYGVRNGYVDTDPTLNLIQVKNPNKEAATVPDEVFWSTWWQGNDRDRIWLALARWCGLRRFEFAALKWGDVSSYRDSGEITITRKGGDRQVMPIEDLLNLAEQPDVERLFHNWLGVHRGRADRHIYPASKYGSHTWVNKRLHVLNDGAFQPHMLRHTCITEWITVRKLPVHLVAHLAGHRDLSTTSRYVHVRNRELRDYL